MSSYKVIIVRCDGDEKRKVKSKSKLILKPGQHVVIPSTTEDDTNYVITMSRAGNCVYCSCPAWKYQRLNPLLRKCKHTISLCGEAYIDSLINRNK